MYECVDVLHRFYASLLQVDQNCPRVVALSSLPTAAKLPSTSTTVPPSVLPAVLPAVRPFYEAPTVVVPSPLSTWMSPNVGALGAPVVNNSMQMNPMFMHHQMQQQQQQMMFFNMQQQQMRTAFTLHPSMAFASAGSVNPPPSAGAFPFAAFPFTAFPPAAFPPAAYPPAAFPPAAFPPAAFPPAVPHNNVAPEVYI